MTWGPIVSMLKSMEKMLQQYAIPVAFIDGDKLAELALEFELELQPTVNDLLTAIVNREDVESLINAPVSTDRVVDCSSIFSAESRLCSPSY